MATQTDTEQETDSVVDHNVLPSPTPTTQEMKQDSPEVAKSMSSLKEEEEEKTATEDATSSKAPTGEQQPRP